MSMELANAAADLATAMQDKFTTLSRQTRAATDELADIRALLAAGRRTESKAAAGYRQSWLRALAAGDRRALASLPDQFKDITELTAAAGGAGVPETTAAAIGATLRRLEPLIDLIGVDEVAGSDFREPVCRSTGAAALVGEAGPRELHNGAPGAFFEVAPTWGEFYAYVSVSEWARQDVGNLEAFLVAEFARQFRQALGTSIWSGDASADLHGLIHTAPSTTFDDGSNVSPNALRDQNSLQYISSSGSPITVPRFSDIENLLGEFSDAHLADESFAIVMRSATWRALVAAENITDAALMMPRQPTLYGYAVRFSGALPAVASNAFAIAAGVWRQAYKCVSRAPLAVTIDENMTEPGVIRYYARQRFGGIVRDHTAAKLLKLGA